LKKVATILYSYPILLFTLFLVVAYLPVLLPFFHIKNDLITQNLPTRFVFSESLYSGFEPFWNPFINFGIPQYGDMNNGFWNPLQWIIGSTVGYNIYTITFEELFYILIGSWGVYKVCREFFSKNVALVTGMAYMCMGYVTGHLQYFCWITGVGYFPFVILFYLRTNKTPSVQNFILTGISIFLFLSSTHPGLIIGALYFFLFLGVAIYLNRNHFLKPFYHKHFFLINFLILVIGCLLSSVVIISNIDVLGFISRGSKVSVEETLLHPTSLQSYISVYLPLIVHKSVIFNTDIGMRNVYTGIFSVLGIFVAIRFLTKRQLLTAFIPLTFFILLAAGGLFKEFAWGYLPLLGYVRLNGEFAYFVLLILLACGAYGAELIFQKKYNLSSASYLLNTFLAITLIILITGTVMVLIKGISFTTINFTGSIKYFIKGLLDNLSIYDLILIQSIIQLVTLLLLKKFFSNKLKLTLVFAFNLIIITWLTLPFTGLGMMSKKEVESVINTFPKGIKHQDLVSIKDAKYISQEYESAFMLISSYSKKIGYLHPDQYPVQLNTNNDFSADKNLYEFIQKQPYLFLSTDTTINAITAFDSSKINVIRAGPGHIKCVIKNENYKWLILLQNNYKYWNVNSESKPTKHFTVFKTFIGIPIKPGVQKIEFRFEPRPIKLVLWFNIALLISALMLLIWPGIRNFMLIK
jgi:hypothetical protein